MKTLTRKPAPVKSTAPRRPFGEGLIELDQHETTAVNSARDRAAADARRKGLPAERVEAEAARAAREANACMMTLRKSSRGPSAADVAWWAYESNRETTVHEVVSRPAPARHTPVRERRAELARGRRDDARRDRLTARLDDMHAGVRAVEAVHSGLIHPALADRIVRNSTLGY